jgi:hypothetical protein
MNTWLRSPRPLRRLGSCSIALLLALSGCGGKSGEVEGTVTWNGEPIPWGRITFVCEGGAKPARTSKIIKGRYKVTDCPAGKAKISIESFPVPDRGKQETGKDLTKGFGPPKGDEAPPPELAGKFVKIPAELSNPETSALQYTIVAGKQSHDFKLP